MASRPLAGLVLALFALVAPAYAQPANAQPAQAQTAPAQPLRPETPLPLDLNRLEPMAGPGEGCRIWMVLANDAPEAAAIDSLRLDLVVFGADGQIARRAAVELGPVGSGRTAVRLFDLANLACDRIGRVLVNEVLACRIGGRDLPGCAELIRPTSRAGIRFGL